MSKEHRFLRDPSHLSLLDIENALDWVFGGQPNKSDKSRVREHDLRALRYVPPIRELVGDGVDLARLEHASREYGLQVSQGFTAPLRQAAECYLATGESIGRREQRLAAELGKSDVRSVHDLRRQVRSSLANFFLDEVQRSHPDTDISQQTEQPSTEELNETRILPVLVGVSVLLVGGALALMQQRGSVLSFSLSPPECPVDVCNSPTSPITGISSGFTATETVQVLINTPSGVDANELGGVYSYGTTPAVRRDGSFTWVYWWDPGMEIGTYTTTVTDLATGESVSRSFTFLPAIGTEGGKPDEPAPD